MAYERLHVPVPGGEIYATRTGTGRPGLFLHGGPGLGAEYLVGLIEETDGLFDAVLPQQRGLEPSTLEGPRDVETHVADAIAVLDHLGWERAWLVGHSWGSHLAMHIAVAHPERVSGLVLIGTLGAVGDGGAAEMNQALVDRLTPDERATLDGLLARAQAGDASPTLMAEILMTLWPSYSYIHGNVLPPTSLRLERPLPDAPSTMDSVRAHLDAGTLERGLPSLRVPALFIVSEGDPMPASAAEASASLIPGAEIVVVERGGHFPWLERRGEFRPVIETFLAEHPAPAIPDSTSD